LSLRDFILPELAKAIGTANYDDEILRTLGFIKQLEWQTSKGLFVTSGNHRGIKPD